ncbi:succinyldiaminopimelate transaminase [Ketobacter sp. MCCC 1A13808]|uniref:succinyldiaminopimelate transaminase n=1 Tax=Ketobacter sp. MCCC 1A13808 TaxID=2602738 RepID=UPI000F17F9FA|nr:succinyldiaminopimelate transaminase [Ketobacter sp. MCCC 1A13808]MVF12727.1 succinyldiaminopimelate transaminase [Ketobacter sp. MCCC 1A13808]RLP53989.1 MAG: succinyldiaminopimelate transaminase [Ketobacter sp.]
MNPDLQKLHSYPFEKLATLFKGAAHSAGLSHIALSIGEPKHPSPEFVKQSLIDAVDKLAVYPTTKGIPEFRAVISRWACTRFQLGDQGLCPETQVLPVNGTREALFAFAQAMIDRSRDPLVISPNPFYQIYEGAALLAGAQPYFLPCLESNAMIPDYDAVPADVWRRCQLLFVCSPGNPTGAVTDEATLKQLIELADEHDFIIASDECYSELYFDESNPPTGLLQVCKNLGRDDFSRCVVFHSLSKRSNLPGLRSGFVAGDAALLSGFLKYRTYHGCAMPVQHQLASVAAWSDEDHVRENRRLYQQKFSGVLTILDGHLNLSLPDAGFYLWPQTPTPDTDFARNLFQQQHVTVLPGSYLSRTVNGVNPGANRVRMALVAPVAQCLEAAERIKHFIHHH